MEAAALKLPTCLEVQPRQNTELLVGGAGGRPAPPSGFHTCKMFLKSSLFAENLQNTVERQFHEYLWTGKLADTEICRCCGPLKASRAM